MSGSSTNLRIIPLAEVERNAIIGAIIATGGNLEAAARALGIGRTTLFRKKKEYASALEKFESMPVREALGSGVGVKCPNCGTVHMAGVSE